MSEELKPCPFCGVVPDIQEEPDAWYDGDSAFYVVCMNDDCRMCVETEAYLTREEVIKAWNTRAERTCHNIAGEWNKKYRGENQPLAGTSFVCSECGARLCDAEDYFAYMGVPEEPDNLKYHKLEPVHHCPNCGAKVVKK